MTKSSGKSGSRQRVRISPEAKKSDVGYGRPPRAHQFKPGQSGNPKGRKKGVKNLSTILQEVLQQKVRLTEHGRIRKITVLEAAVRRVAEDSLKGNIKSIAFLFNRYEAILAGETAQLGLGEDDKVVLDAYLEQFQSKSEADEDGA